MWLGGSERNLEWTEINLSEGRFVDNDVHGTASLLGVVADKVLDDSSDTVLLKASDVARGHLARQNWVL